MYFLSPPVKANASENQKLQLNEEELLAQMRYVFGTNTTASLSFVELVSTSVIILAGHETTANTLSWMLLELSRNPEIQTKLRYEIRTMEHTIRSRGDSEFKASDFDAMPYLLAVVKVNRCF